MRRQQSHVADARASDHFFSRFPGIPPLFPGGSIALHQKFSLLFQDITDFFLESAYTGGVG
ncbi:MAG: hypothetical protein LBU39_07705 [Desulfobulbaceae bacterium]|jgi:hypothetical protein|nr:hypothetical protein [Desulfobulbaceae bacterium]